MDTTILEELKGHIATPCVSVIIPTHKLSPERALDELHVNQVIKKAEELVLDKFGKNKIGEEIILKLNELVSQIDFVHNDLGLGFYVSPEVSHLVRFPFAVKEKIIVGNSFEIRDIIYLEATLLEYCLFVMNEKELKLFDGKGESLTMYKNKDFPAHFVDDYEYERPSLGSSYGYALKSTEKDKSIVNEQRLMMFLKQADQKMSKYVSPHTPLIISGNSKDIGYFKKNTIHSTNIIGEIHGNYLHENIQTLGVFAFEKITEYLKIEEEKLLTRFENAIGKKLAVHGIQDVWTFANEGKGLLLLVEKDYMFKGYILPNDSALYSTAPKKQHEILEDAVDDVMEVVMNKGGKVVVMEEGRLQQYGKIALILRYR